MEENEALCHYQIVMMQPQRSEIRIKVGPQRIHSTKPAYENSDCPHQIALV
jgi:hypothetical protein